MGSYSEENAAVRFRSGLLACVLLAACGTPTQTPSRTPAPHVSAWVPEMIDPAPGPNVTAAIADALGVPDDDVVAAVFLLRHPAGNGASIWVFRADGMPSHDALEQWGLRQPKCQSAPIRGSIAGLDMVTIHRRAQDQCRPQYLIPLDNETLAVITDDGAYAGNAAGTPTVPYRPVEDIAALLTWLQERLETVELQPGGPPLVQG
jgi:hypothetical protein